MLNEKLRKFYLYKLKEIKEKVTLIIFNAMQNIIKYNICSFALYFLLVIIETFQILSLITQIQLNSNLEIKISGIMEYFHLTNILNSNLISFQTYVYILLFHFFFEIFSQISFFLVGVNTYETFTTYFSYFYSLKLSF